MSYSPEVYSRVQKLYEERRSRALTDLEGRIGQAKEQVPGLAPVEEVLGATGVRVMEAIKKKDGGKALETVRRENEELVERRKVLLRNAGFPEDFCDPRFLCPRCGDTGYREGRRCTCLKEALYEAQAELSGLGRLLKSQNFENFQTHYYSDREEAGKLRDFCQEYARKGIKEGQNLLLMGATGLGKTHLSTAIAGAAMRAEFSVIYESAPNILADFQYEQFGRGYSDRTPVRTDKYFCADLLIIDDLGSEMSNQFTVSVIYNLLNTRLNQGLSTLINTNLSPKELVERYDRRITSRILGEFTLFTLEGRDVRMQKLNETTNK